MAFVAWITTTYRDTEVVDIPEGNPQALGASDMFNPATVIFKGSKESHQIGYRSPEQAALVAELARVEIRGHVEIPKSSSECKECLEQLKTRLLSAEERFTELSASRTGTQTLQEKTAALLLHWYTYGKSS